jgi:dihydroflavonol-4-reductase
MPVAISGSFNLCDVRDLADGLIKAADKGRKGECYILGNEAISFKEFAKTIAEESGCKPMRFFLPGWVAYKLAEVLEKNELARFRYKDMYRRFTFDGE